MKIFNNRWFQLVAFLLIISPLSNRNIPGIDILIGLLILVIIVPPIRRRVGLDRLSASSKNEKEEVYDIEAPAKLNSDKYVDGINDPSITSSIARRRAKIFHRGFQLKVGKGTWYELYVKNRDDGPMSYKPLSDRETKMKEALEIVFLGSHMSDFEAFGQCTFYVSDKQELLTLDKFLCCMESVYVQPDDGSDFDQTTFNVNLRFLKLANDLRTTRTALSMLKEDKEAVKKK